MSIYQLSSSTKRCNVRAGKVSVVYSYSLAIILFKRSVIVALFFCESDFANNCIDYQG